MDAETCLGDLIMALEGRMAQRSALIERHCYIFEYGSVDDCFIIEKSEHNASL